MRDAMVGGAETVARVCLGRGHPAVAACRLDRLAVSRPASRAPSPAPRRPTRSPSSAPTTRGPRCCATGCCCSMHAHGRAAGRASCGPAWWWGRAARRFIAASVSITPSSIASAGTPARNPLPFVLADDVAAAIVLACTAPGIEGRCYNLVGDVRLTAREYIAALGQALGRPLQYHPQSPRLLWLEDSGKWARQARRPGGRSRPPSQRDFLSRGLMARFDCADAARDLGWQPVARPRDVRAAAPLPCTRRTPPAPDVAAWPRCCCTSFRPSRPAAPQVRFAAIANRFGRAWRHAIMAMDGNVSCRERLDAGAGCGVSPRSRCARATRSAISRPLRAALRALRPDVLVTSNWGTIEWALANALPLTRTLVRHVHTEDGFGPEEQDPPIAAPRLAAPAGAAPRDRRGAVAHTARRSPRKVWRLDRAACAMCRTGSTWRASPAPRRLRPLRTATWR